MLLSKISARVKRATNDCASVLFESFGKTKDETKDAKFVAVLTAKEGKLFSGVKKVLESAPFDTKEEAESYIEGMKDNPAFGTATVKTKDETYPEDFIKYGWELRQNGRELIATNKKLNLEYRGAPYEIMPKLNRWLADSHIGKMNQKDSKTKDDDQLIERYKGVNIWYDRTRKIFWAAPYNGAAMSGHSAAEIHPKIDNFRNLQTGARDSANEEGIKKDFNEKKISSMEAAKKLKEIGYSQPDALITVSLWSKGKYYQGKDSSFDWKPVEPYKGFRILYSKYNKELRAEKNGKIIAQAGSRTDIEKAVDKYLRDSKSKDSKNWAGERSFRTYEAWKRACKEIDPTVKFDGDKDICQAGKIGEWDGNEGIIYSKDSKTKDDKEIEYKGYIIYTNMFAGKIQVLRKAVPRGPAGAIIGEVKGTGEESLNKAKAYIDKKVGSTKDAATYSQLKSQLAATERQLANAKRLGESSDVKEAEEEIIQIKKQIADLEKSGKTQDDIFYNGTYLKSDEIYKLLVKEGKTIKRRSLTEMERKEREGNLYPLYESREGLLAVVDGVPKDPFVKHQIEIAKKTLNMPDAMVAVMGGMTKQQAREILKKYGISFKDCPMKRTHLRFRIKGDKLPFSLRRKIKDALSKDKEENPVAKYGDHIEYESKTTPGYMLGGTVIGRAGNSILVKFDNDFKTKNHVSWSPEKGRYVQMDSRGYGDSITKKDKEGMAIYPNFGGAGKATDPQAKEKMWKIPAKPGSTKDFVDLRELGAKGIYGASRSYPLPRVGQDVDYYGQNGDKQYGRVLSVGGGKITFKNNHTKKVERFTVQMVDSKRTKDNYPLWMGMIQEISKRNGKELEQTEAEKILYEMMQKGVLKSLYNQEQANAAISEYLKTKDTYDPTRPKNIAAAKNLAKAQGRAAADSIRKRFRDGIQRLLAKDKKAKDSNTEFPIGKHDDVPDDKFDEKELALGIDHEMEHTADPDVAKSIAKDHLSENPKYYSEMKSKGLDSDGKNNYKYGDKVVMNSMTELKGKTLTILEWTPGKQAANTYIQAHGRAKDENGRVWMITEYQIEG